LQWGQLRVGAETAKPAKTLDGAQLGPAVCNATTKMLLDMQQQQEMTVGEAG
jgi:hypothetical protein